MVAIAPLQRSIFDLAHPGDGPLRKPFRTLVERRWLDDWCWVDVASGWFVGGDELLVRLVERLDWQQRTRPMYDRMVHEPRLTAFIASDDPRLGPTGLAIVAGIDAHYDDEFGPVGCNYYRDGADSVAWHADRIARHEINPLVAIACLGGPRPFRLRPKGGGTSINYDLASGDVLVMGGATQHRWEHCVPKVTFAPPRLSLSIRSVPRAARQRHGATLATGSLARSARSWDDATFGH